jgi:hypothetical protein
VEAEMNRLKQLKEDLEMEKESSDEVCSETDDEAERDDEAQVMDLDEEVLAWEPLPDNPQSTRISDPEKKSDSRSGVARRSQAPKRSRIVVSDDESEESAGAILPSPPKRKFTRSSVKSTDAVKAHPPSSGRKTKKPETETLDLSSDDNEPLATALQGRRAATRKKTSPLEHEKVNSPKNSRARINSLARRSGVAQRSPERSNMQEDGAWTARRLMDVGHASRRKDEEFNDESQPEDVEERRGTGGAGDMGKTIASGHNARGSRGEARKSTSSHHDGAASHNSDTHTRSSLMQVTIMLLCIILYDHYQQVKYLFFS